MGDVQKRSSLIVDVRPGERLEMVGAVTVELLHKSGRNARLRVTAPADMRITKKPITGQESHYVETRAPV